MDEFGHAEIATRLAQAILDKRNSGASVVGVCGKWGSGKSGVLNLLEKYIDQASAPSSSANTHRASVVRFEPWLVGSRSALIANFFGQLVKAVEEIRQANLDPLKGDKKLWLERTKRLKKALQSFGEVATQGATAAAVIDPTAASAFTAASLRTGTTLLKKFSKEDESLDAKKKEVLEALASAAELRPNFRLVVLVDDVDRLEPLEAVEVLRLMKAVGAFPHITYIVAYDKDVLARAVEIGTRVQNGHAFIEKIVQFSFSVPLPEHGRLLSWLQRVIESEFEGAADFQSRRAAIVLSHWSRRLIQVPRDVKRWLVSVRMMWPPISESADFLDLAWLELIKEKAGSGEINLYKWVQDYLQTVETVADGASVISKVKVGEELDSILRSLGWHSYKFGGDGDTENPDPHYLGTILPGIREFQLSEDSVTEVFDFNGEAEWQNFLPEQRLGSPRHWRMYFGFELPSSALTDADSRRIFEASSISTQSLITSLTDLLEKYDGKISNITDQIIFERLEPRLNALSSVQSKNWFEALFIISSKLAKGSARDSWLGVDSTFEFRFRRVVAALFDQFASNSPIKAFANLLSSEPEGWAVAEFIRSEVTYHKRAKQGEASFATETCFAEDQLDVIGEMTRTFFKSLTWQKIGEGLSPWEVLFCWRDIDGIEEASHWLQVELSNDELLCDRLEKLITYSNRSDGLIPHLRADYLNYFVDVTDLKARLSQIASSESPSSDKASYLLSIWRDQSEKF